MFRHETALRSTVGSNIEDQVQCPFVPSHMLRREKFALHLTKCRKSLKPDSPFYAKAMSLKVCRFNNTHYFPNDKLEEHYKFCESAKTFNNSMQLKDQEKLGWEHNVAPVVATTLVDDDDDWDNDAPVQAYDPTKKVLSNPMLLVNPAGKTRSERQMYRQNRRLQANGGEVNDFEWASDGENEGENSPSVDTFFTEKIPEKSKPEQRPRTQPKQVEVKEVLKVRDWGDSEDEIDTASGKVDTMSDDFDDWEPPQEAYRPLRRPTSNQGDGLQSTFTDSGAKSGHLSIPEAVPQPTMMGIGRGVGRGKLASPPGFHSSTSQATVPSIDATAENFNMKLNLGICTGMHHTIGIGRGRGFGRGQH